MLDTGWRLQARFGPGRAALATIDRLPALDPQPARTWLLAHLIAAVPTDAASASATAVVVDVGYRSIKATAVAMIGLAAY